MTTSEPAGITDGAPSGFGRNRPLAEAIVAWRDFPWPRRQAFFVQGKRGGGKTRLVMEAMRLPSDRFRPESLRYVSLHGVRDVSEIEARLSPGERRVLVFDDLERSLLPPADVLAFAGSFLEHGDVRVFILVNEDEFDSQDPRYASWRERIAGPSWRVLPDTDRAFDAFLAEIADDRVRALCRRHEAAIKVIFVDSGFDDLRLLQRALWDFERLWSAMAERHRACDAGVGELLLVLCAMSIELRAKRLEKSLLWRATWTHYALPSEPDGERRALSVGDLLRRYPAVRFDVGILSTDCITDLVQMVDVPAALIQRQLDEHPWFNDIAALPSWRALWFSFLLPDSAVPGVVERFIEDFRAHRFQEEAEIRHALGLCVWLARIGDKNFPLDTLGETLDAYVAAVYADRPAGPADLVPSPAADTGLMVRCVNDELFEKANATLAREVQGWRERGYAEAAANLLEMLKSDSLAFLRDICHSTSGPGRFARLPVLRLISPERFAVALLALPYRDRINVLSGLSNRYDSVLLRGELAREREWLRMVHDRLSELAAGLVPVARSHFLGQLGHYLGDLIWRLNEERAGRD